MSILLEKKQRNEGGITGIYSIFDILHKTCSNNLCIVIWKGNLDNGLIS